MNWQPAKVLLVEDNDNDIELVKRTLKKGKLMIDLDVAKSGDEAMSYLAKNTPHLMLLDLFLPDINGFEILKHMREQEEYKNIPVAVLTCSNRDEDLLQSYKLHAQFFLKKPVVLSDFLNLVVQLDNLFLKLGVC